jgi:hypothetical protein
MMHLDSFLGQNIRCMRQPTQLQDIDPDCEADELLIQLRSLAPVNRVSAQCSKSFSVKEFEEVCVI